MGIIHSDNDIKKILQETKTIAVVGASQKPWRDSNSIMQFLLARGFTVIPVNPAYQEIWGMKCYPTLTDVEVQIDIVDVFRNPEAVIPIVNNAIAVNAKTFWMQLGVVNNDAARIASDAGLAVVMDRCIAVEHNRLMRTTL